MATTRRRANAVLSTGAMLETAWAGFAPPERVTVAQYAERHRFLANEGGGYVGRWKQSLVPYIVEPQECLTSLDYLTVALVGPGQSAKTSVGENWLLESVGADPANMLWYMQTDDGVEAYVKNRINTMVDAHDVMRSRQGLRAVDDSLHFKRFVGMTVEFLSATPSNLINKSAGRIVADEVDAYDQSLGDVKATLDVRRQTFGNESMLLAMSHPDLAKGLVPERDWGAGIMAIYADSDRRLWYWPCPHCGAFSSPCPTSARHMALVYDDTGTLDEIEAGAHLECPVNGCVIEDRHRHAMNQRGVWVGMGQEISPEGVISGSRVQRKTAGFWIVGPMSPFILGGVGGLARARVKAEREFAVSGEDETLRTVITKQWGVPYAPPRSVGSVDATDLADRAEQDLRRGRVPLGVRFLTIAVDCQIAHFEYLVRGWGVSGESWIVETGRLLANPATSADDWDQQLLPLFAKGFPLADGSGRSMVARCAAFDSAGAPGVTQQAYAAWSRWRKQRIVRMFGKISGRDAFSIIPTKGAAGANAPRLQVVYPDTSRRANVVAGGGAVPIAMFNPNAFKDDLMGQIIKADVGPWYVHFPWDLRSKEPPHVWFEQAVAEHRLPNGRWERVTPTSRNEALDLLVMTHVAAHLHGLSRIAWGRPPSWAAPWDSNTTIMAVGAVPAAAVIAKPTAVDAEKKAPVSMSDFIKRL